MRLIVTVFLLALSFSAISQTECWECLVAARNLDSKTALERCLKVSKSSKLTTNEKQVVSFVVGRLLLDGDKPKLALKYLTISEGSPDTLLSALSKGLLGDYYLDLKQYDKALDYYKEAANRADNIVYTPFYLNRQGVVYRLKNDLEGLERIGSQLKVNHRNYFLSQGLAWFYGDEPSKYDSLNRTLENHELPKGPYGVGLINGQKVDQSEFLKEVEYTTSVHEQDFLYEDVTDVRFQDQMKHEAWANLIQTIFLSTREKTMALSVNETEFHAYLFAEKGYSLLPEIEQNFTDVEGTFNSEEFAKFLAEKDNDPNPETNAIWLETQRRLKGSMMQEKYLGILKLGVHMSTAEANLLSELRKKVLQVRAVRFPLGYQEDSLFTPTEDEVQGFFQKHKADPVYEYQAKRRIDYFTIPITPGSKDTAAFIKELEALKADFRTAKNDSIFVSEHSDQPLYLPSHPSTFLPESDERATGLTYPESISEKMETAKIGDIVGPYVDNGHFRLAKVVGFNENEITARHILIGAPESDSPRQRAEKRKMAEELAKRITHDNFSEFVVKYSEDPGSVDNGGIYSDFLDFQMVEPFANYAVNAPIGKIGVVETAFGFHIMEVLERKPVNYPKLFVIDKVMQPTNAIQDSVANYVEQLYQKMQLDLKNLSLSQKRSYFDSISKSGQYIRPVMIDDANPFVYGFELKQTSDQLLKYAYSKNVQNYQLFDPINDGSSWIFPVFGYANPGKDYNFEQVYFQSYLDCLRQKKWNAIQKEYSAFGTLEEIASKANLEVIEKGLNWNTFSFEGYLTFNIFYDHSVHSERQKGLLWSPNSSTMMVYEVKSESSDESEVDLATVKQEFQDAMVERWFGQEMFFSASKAPIYNYDLYKLLLRL